jgi:hypothetical protein
MRSDKAGERESSTGLELRQISYGSTQAPCPVYSLPHQVGLTLGGKHRLRQLTTHLGGSVKCESITEDVVA